MLKIWILMKYEWKSYLADKKALGVILLAPLFAHTVWLCPLSFSSTGGSGGAFFPCCRQFRFIVGDPHDDQPL